MNFRGGHGHSLVVECLPNKFKVLDLILSTLKKKSEGFRGNITKTSISLSHFTLGFKNMTYIGSYGNVCHLIVMVSQCIQMSKLIKLYPLNRQFIACQLYL
ncbi:hypothetical protein H1C71_005792, partial [Ictidomys tridecemlineatus]